MLFQLPSKSKFTKAQFNGKICGNSSCERSSWQKWFIVNHAYIIKVKEDLTEEKRGRDNNNSKKKKTAQQSTNMKSLKIANGYFTPTCRNAFAPIKCRYDSEARDYDFSARIFPYRFGNRIAHFSCRQYVFAVCMAIDKKSLKMCCVCVCAVVGWSKKKSSNSIQKTYFMGNAAIRFCQTDRCWEVKTVRCFFLFFVFLFLHN